MEELYGDSKDETWKNKEIARLKEEQGISTVQEPEVALEGVNIIEGKSDAENLQHEQERVPGTSESGQ